MGQLDGDWHVGMAAHGLDGFIKAGLGCVIPQAKIAVGDASFGFDRTCFYDQKSCAGLGEVAKMHVVPCGGAAVVSGVLTHWRNDNAIIEGQFPQRQGRE